MRCWCCCGAIKYLEEPIDRISAGWKVSSLPDPWLMALHEQLADTIPTAGQNYVCWAGGSDAMKMIGDEYVRTYSCFPSGHVWHKIGLWWWFFGLAPWIILNSERVTPTSGHMVTCGGGGWSRADTAYWVRRDLEAGSKGNKSVAKGSAHCDSFAIHAFGKLHWSIGRVMRIDWRMESNYMCTQID